jgi:hypothetical protein
MKTHFTNRFLLLSFALAGFIFLSANSYAQQKHDDQPKGQKTITIHVTKVEDGRTIVIDTTVVTDGDFNADAYLEDKGVMRNSPGSNEDMEKEIIIRHPGKHQFEQGESDENLPDTIIINTDRVYAFNDHFDMDAPLPPLHPDMPFEYFQYDNPQEFSHFDGHQMEDMLQELARSFGLEDVMPFGDMKQIVVKKKHNGKKVIITFEDRDKSSAEHSKKHEEKIIILNDNNTGMAARHEERVIIQGDPGEGNGAENGTQSKQQKKVIIIQEEKTK